MRYLSQPHLAPLFSPRSLLGPSQSPEGRSIPYLKAVLTPQASGCLGIVWTMVTSKGPYPSGPRILEQ